MRTIIITMLLGGMLVACNNKQITNNNMEQELDLTQEWDKVFPLSEKVNHQKVTFMTQYGLTLAADLYTPASPDPSKERGEKLPAIAVSGPFGAVKEQCSGLYAMKMAERAAVNRVARHRPTSIPRTLWQQSISCQNRTMWMPNGLASSAFAVGEASR